MYPSQKLLVNRYEDYEIVAVEPHEEMRRELQKKGLKVVKVLKGEPKAWI